MIPEAELAYDAVGNYSTACAATAKMRTAIDNTGAKSSCYSFSYAPTLDLNTRWGATGIKYSSTLPLQAWSASNMGVVTWDAQGVNTSGAFIETDMMMNLATATFACATAGGRLPTIEELLTLASATDTASGGITHTPPGFVGGVYYSSSVVPSNIIWSYNVDMLSGSWNGYGGSSQSYVHCVR